MRARKPSLRLRVDATERTRPLQNTPPEGAPTAVKAMGTCKPKRKLHGRLHTRGQGLLRPEKRTRRAPTTPQDPTGRHRHTQASVSASSRQHRCKASRLGMKAGGPCRCEKCPTRARDHQEEKGHLQAQEVALEGKTRAAR
jgi:hypothetical protein